MLQGDGALAGLRPSQRAGDYLGGHSSPPRQASPVFGRDPSPPRAGTHWTDLPREPVRHWTDHLHEVIPSEPLDRWIARRDHQAMGHPMPPAAFPHRATHVSDPYGTHGASHRGGGGLHDWLANRDDRAMGRPARTSAFTPPASAAAVHAWPEARPASPPTGRPARSEAPAAPARHEEFSFNAWAQQPAGRTQRASASAQRPEPLETPAASHIRKATTTTTTPSGKEKIRIDLGQAIGSMSTELQAELRQGMRQSSAGSTRLQGVDKRLADAFADALKELGASGHRLPASPLVTEKALQLASSKVAREMLMSALAKNPPSGADIFETKAWMAPSAPPPTLESSAASWLASIRNNHPGRPDVASAAAASLADDLLTDLNKAKLSVFGGKVYLDDDLEPRLAGALLRALEEGASQGYDLSSHEAVMQQAKLKAARQVANRLIDEHLQKEKAGAPAAHASPSRMHAGTSAGRQLPLETLAASHLREATTIQSWDGKPRIDLTKAIRFMGDKLQFDLRQCMQQTPAGSTRLQGVDQRLADAFANALKELGADGHRPPVNPLVTEKALQLASSRVARAVLMQELSHGHGNANIAEPPERRPPQQPPLGSRVASLLTRIREERSKNPERLGGPGISSAAIAVLEGELQKDLEKASLSVVDGRVRLDGVDPRLAEAVDTALQEVGPQGYGLSSHQTVLQDAKMKAARKLASKLVGEQLRQEASEARRAHAVASAQAPARHEPRTAEHAGPLPYQRVSLEKLAASYIKEARTEPRGGFGTARIDLTKALRFMDSSLQSDLLHGMGQASRGSARLQGIDGRLAEAFAGAMKELGADGHRLPANPLVTEKAMQLASSRVAREVLMQELSHGPRNVDIVESGSWVPRPSQPTLASRTASLLAGIREEERRKPEGSDGLSVNSIAVAVLQDDLRKDLEKATLSAAGGRVFLDGVDPLLAEAVESALQEVAAQGYELSSHQVVLQKAKTQAARKLASRLVREHLQKEASEAQQRAARAEPPPAEFSFNAWLPPDSSGVRRS